MVARESVRARLGTGISFTEFSYQVLQAYDFLALHERYGCTAQMGGSDQWGNITAGTELIRKVRGAEARTAALFGGAGDVSGPPDAVLQAAAPLPVWRVLKDAGLVSSTSEARRLIQQGGVEVDGERVTDLAETIAAGPHTVKLGKRRISRVILKGPKV